jgi:hypothetical protein
MTPRSAYLRPGTLQPGALPPLSLYVHLPWCLKKCPYCDFNSPRRAAAGELPERATSTRCCADLEAALPLVWGRRVVSVFIGGGTPSLFSPAGIDRLLADMRARLPLEPAARSRWRPTPAPSSASASGLPRRRRHAAVDRRAELRRRRAAAHRPRARRGAQARAAWPRRARPSRPSTST